MLRIGKHSDNMFEFSIIIPVYNVANYINECLYSVYIQSENISFEVIIINDGSSDNSLDLINLFISKNKLNTDQWKVLTQKNSGLSAARNAGISYATGNYIIFLDSDDALVFGSLEILKSTLIKNDVEVLVFAGNDFFDRNLSLEADSFNVENDYYFESYSRKLYDNQRMTGSEFLFESYENGVFQPNACFHCIRLDFLLNSQIKFLEGVYFEDNLFTRELYLKTENLYVINIPVIVHRQRHGSIMNSNWSNEKTKSIFIVIHEIKKLRIFNPQMIQHADDLMYNLINRLRKTNSPLNLHYFLFNKNFWSNQRSRLLLKLTLLERVKQRIKILIH
jgi:glycosyltransferase involved in cell wall biosynthesis